MRLGGGKYATTGLRAGQSLTRRNDAGAAVFKRITLVCLAACLTALPAFAAETPVRVVTARDFWHRFARELALLPTRERSGLA